MSEIESGDYVMLKGLVNRPELNHHAARVLRKSWTAAVGRPGRVPIEMFSERFDKEQLWVKLKNLAGPIPNMEAMTAPPFHSMDDEERADLAQIFNPPVQVGNQVLHTACGPLSCKSETYTPWFERRCDAVKLYQSDTSQEGTAFSPDSFVDGVLTLWQNKVVPSAVRLTWHKDGCPNEPLPVDHNFMECESIGRSSTDENLICAHFVRNEDTPDEQHFYYYFAFPPNRVAYFMRTIDTVTSSDESLDESLARGDVWYQPGPDWTESGSRSAAMHKTHTPPEHGYSPNQTTGVKWSSNEWEKGRISLWKYNKDPHTANLVWHPRDETSDTHIREDMINLRCVSLSVREDTILMRFEHTDNEDDTRSNTVYYWFWFEHGAADPFLNQLRELNVSKAPTPPLSAKTLAAAALGALPPGDRGVPFHLEDDSEPAPAPAPDRRAAARAVLRNMIHESDPRPHYCIYCGSEGLYGDKCVPCGFYRGSHCFGPDGPLQKGDTLMGRKLAFVKWPWQGDPKAPYVRAGVAPDAEPEPKSKYAVDPPPVRALTRDEVLGPTLGGCAGVCPKYPTCTAARLVGYVLGKVDHVTQGVAVDFRYCLRTHEDWHKMRERIIEIHEAGEENAAEVLHEEYLVAHHTLSQTAPAYLPADWDGMKRRVNARQKKDKGAEEPEALAYPDSDADEDDVTAYLEAMARRA